MNAHEPSVRRFLEALPPSVRTLLEAAARRVKTLAPSLVETCDGRSLGLGFGTDMSRLVCILTPEEDHVRIVFHRGDELPDPAELLQGRGVLSRYVVVRTPADLEAEALTELLRAAIRRSRP